MSTAVAGLWFYLCLSVCLFFRTISRITKLDIEIFNDESWKLIYFGIKMSKVKVTSHGNITGVGFCTLVSAGFFWLKYCRVFASDSSRHCLYRRRPLYRRLIRLT